MSEEALQIAEKRREAKGKGIKERYTPPLQESKRMPSSLRGPPAPSLQGVPKVDFPPQINDGVLGATSLHPGWNVQGFRLSPEGRARKRAGLLAGGPWKGKGRVGLCFPGSARKAGRRQKAGTVRCVGLRGCPLPSS